MNAIKYILIFMLFFIGTSGWLAAQDFVIEGNVYSAKNLAPLKDIEVKVADKPGNSATTDDNGHYKITASSPVVKLSFSYPGYITLEKYNTREEMTVLLYEEGQATVEQPVSLGYSVTNQKNLSQAAEKVRISPEELASVESFDLLLKNSSAQVTKNSGSVGEGATVNIRGYSSVFANVKPLIVIDGMALENYSFDEGAINGLYHNPLFNIDPRDIESITILKDAAATAIYGAKGANGVIVVKTNAVGVGETSIGISAFAGANLVQHDKIPVLFNNEDTKSYLLGQMYGSGLTTDQINERYPYFREDNTDPLYYRYNNQTDWQDQAFEMGKNAGFHVNMKGGDEIAKYYFAGGFLHNEGNITNSATNRYNFRLNALVTISPKIDANANIGFTYSDGNYLEQGNVISTNPLLASLVKAPFMTTHLLNSENEKLPITADADEMGFSNPYEVINNTEARRSMYNFLGKINFEYKISKEWRANALISTEISKLRDGVFLPDWGFGTNGDYAAQQVIKHAVGRLTNIYGEANIKYHKSFNYVHNLDGIAGFRASSAEVDFVNASGRNTASDHFKDLGGTTGREDRGGYHELWNDFAWFGNLNYNYKEKYYATAVASIDASSRFGIDANALIPGVPSVASLALGASWDVANEDFLANSKTIDMLKLRASIGNTANSGIGAYSSKYYYSAVQYYTTTGLIRGNIPNEKLHWEKNMKKDFGVDVSLFRNRLTINADLYQQTTKDMLSFTVPPDEYGYDKYWQNSGELKTNGYEVSASIAPVDNKNFRWDIRGTIGSYKMKMENIADGSYVLQVGDAEKLFANGSAPGLFYGYKTNGVIKSQSDADALGLSSQGNPFGAGDILFTDTDNNKVIDEADRVVIGDPTPDFYGSVTNMLKYKWLSLEAVTTFVQGNDVYNQPRRILEGMKGFENQSLAVTRRWQIDGQDTDIPKATFGDPMGNSRFSDRWIEDGSYVRLNRVTLSLDISQWVKNVKRASVYVSGLNLFTITNYLGYDPEFSYNHSMLWNGIDYGKFPQYSTVMVGLKFEL